MNGPNVGEAKNRVTSALGLGNLDLEKLLESGSDEQKAEALSKAVSHLNKSTEALHFFPSSSAYFSFLSGIMVSDPMLAATAIYMRSTNKDRVGQISFRSVDAAALNMLFLTGSFEGAAGMSGAKLESLLAKYESLVVNANEEFHSKTQDLDAKLSAIDSKLERLRETFSRWFLSRRRLFSNHKDRILKAFLREISQLTERNKDELSSFRGMVEKEIALQAPVEYWTSKRNGHRAATVVLGLVFLVYGAFLIGFAKSQIMGLGVSFDQVFGVLANLGLEGLSIVFLLVALCLIVSRIIYRLFASQLHLWNDASERITMIQTYLALALKGHAKEDHMEALVNRLFAPASDGVVRDDFGTITGVESVINRATR